MIIGRSGDAPEPFKPRQPKMLPHDWSPGSPDANVLLAAGRYRQGLRPVNAFTARDATTLDICKHHVLIVSLDSLAELHALQTRPGVATHLWAPLGPPAVGKFGGQPVDEAEEGVHAAAGSSG